MKQPNLLDSREDGSYDRLLEQMRRNERMGAVILVVTILAICGTFYGIGLFLWMLVKRVMG